NGAIQYREEAHWGAGPPSGRWLRKLVLDDAATIGRFGIQVLDGSQADEVHELYKAGVCKRIVKTLIARDSCNRDVPTCMIRPRNRLNAKTRYCRVAANDVAERRRRAGASSKAANPIAAARRNDVSNCGSFHWIADDETRIVLV